jgi:hypothetical protein
MSMDADGSIWAGSIHRMIHRYDPRTGKISSIKLPYDSSAASCICVGKKVCVLGQSYPRLIIYDREAQAFAEADYPSARPDVWYGTEAVDGRHIYLFDRGSSGVIQWDTQTDTGVVIPWPFPTSLPTSGSFEPRDNAIWCAVWLVSRGEYDPVGLARLDVASNMFTRWYPFPHEDSALRPYGDHATTFFLPYTLKGQLVPFDFKKKRWCKFMPVPGYGRVFGFIGGAIAHNDRYYFSLSTYNGTDTGCDGRPYHFCNAILEFDPRRRRFDTLTLDESNDGYYQFAYMLSAGGEMFVTGTNIREPDGTLNRDRSGEVIFWQTLKPR